MTTFSSATLSSSVKSVFCRICNGTQELHETVSVDGETVARCPERDSAYEPCPGCETGTPVPHVPSSRCRSGKNPHCSCDTCF